MPIRIRKKYVDPTESGFPSGFTTLALCVLNIDFLKVLELEGSNFPVILDVWSQVVERGAGQGCAATPTTDVGDLILKMEDDLLKNLTSGMGVLVALPLFHSICCRIISRFLVLQVWDGYPGSPIRFFLSRFQGQKDSGSRIRIGSKELTVSKLSEKLSGMFNLDPGSGFFPIPDPGSRGQKSTGSLIRIRNTGFLFLIGILPSRIWIPDFSNKNSCRLTPPNQVSK
jgi:hypothetical protein